MKKTRTHRAERQSAKTPKPARQSASQPQGGTTNYFISFAAGISINFNGNVNLPHSCISLGGALPDELPPLLPAAPADPCQLQMDFDADAPHKDDREALVAELLPIFKGSDENVRRFLDLIKDATPTKITALVNEWIREKLIDPHYRHKPLWEILNQHGHYSKSLTNWNKQVI